MVGLYGEGKWCWVARDWNARYGETFDMRRSSKQCRERWIHHLRPDINKKASGPGFMKVYCILSCFLHCQPALLLILFTSGLAHSLLSVPLVFPADPLVCFLAQQSWCEEEERLLVLTHQEVGNKWSEIARRLPGR